MNKSFVLIVISVLCFSSIDAQEYSFGILGGANYSMGGEAIGIDPSGSGFNTDTFSAESVIGFQAGIFFQLNFGKFYVRPEVMYNLSEAEFDFPGQPSIYSIEKLSVPLLFGYNVWGPLDIFAGPAYQNIINSTLQGTDPANTNIVVQGTPIEGQIGAKVNFGRFAIDLRYARLLSDPQPSNYFITSGVYREAGSELNQINFTDTRLHQVMLSLSFKIGDSKANPGRRRGGGCYF